MSGRRLKSYRSGDLSEDLGVFLLKSFSTVATVARQEDVGIDAVCTLLREDDDGLLYAEDSFYVQFKSASDRVLVYKGHEKKWLQSLRLPLFIGSVNRKHATMELYSTHRLSHLWLEKESQELHLHLDRTQEHPSPSGVRIANIGPPLLRWTITDLADSGFAQRAYSHLKIVIEGEARNLKYRDVQYCEYIRWETNGLPYIAGASCKIGRQPEMIQDLLKDMEPHLWAMLGYSHSKRDRPACVVLYELIEVMRKWGFDPYPGQKLLYLESIDAELKAEEENESKG